jgi:hypothetical protein
MKMSQSKTRLLELNARLAQNLTDKGVKASSDESQSIHAIALMIVGYKVGTHKEIELQILQ